jgi:gephyrin
VIRKPIVAVLSTGDELIDISMAGGGSPPPGKIYDSNRGMLMAALVAEGFEPFDAGIARDSIEDTRRKLRSAWNSADVIISSGGVSMGEVDCVKTVLLQMGATIHFGRVNMKPGKPTTFATMGRKIFFALPGNPVSAMVCFHLFAMPSIRQMSGLSFSPLIVQAQLAHDFALDRERPEYHRCRVNSIEGKDGLRTFVAESTGIQASHRLLSMSGANGMVVLPSGNGVLKKGSLADVVIIDKIQ